MDQVVKQYEIEMASLKRELAAERKKNEEPEALRRKLNDANATIEMLTTQIDALRVENKYLKEKENKVVKPVKKVPVAVVDANEPPSEKSKDEPDRNLTDTSDIIYFQPGEDPFKPKLYEATNDIKAVPASLTYDSDDDFVNAPDVMYLGPNEVALLIGDKSNAIIIDKAQNNVSIHSPFPLDVDEEPTSICDTYGCYPDEDPAYDTDTSDLSNVTFNLY